MAGFRSGTLCGAALAFTAAFPAAAQQQQQQEQPRAESGFDERLRRGAIFDKSMNLATIGALTEGASGSSIRVTAELSHAFDRLGQVRILAMVGKGSVQNIADIMYLKGADVSIVQTDALEYYRQKIWGGVDKSIQYITSMYEEEVHVLARKDVGGLNELAGKKVNLDLPGSGSHLTGSILFERLDIPVEVVTLDLEQALGLMARGEIAAVVSVSGKPLGLPDRVTAGRAGDHHFLAVPPAPQLLETYRPARLTHEDYPGLVPPDAPVDTIAVRSVLAVFNWPAGSDRHARLARFVDGFFSGFDQLKADYRHPKWREVDIRAEIPGWTRSRPARDWLRKHPVATRPQDDPALREAFEAFLRERAPGLVEQLGEAERARLFDDFRQWQGGQRGADAAAAALTTPARPGE